MNWTPPDAEKAQDYLQRVGEDLMPLLDRANRMLIRNLKAIHEMRRGAPAMVSIRDVGQVNVGERQVNVASPVNNG